MEAVVFPDAVALVIGELNARLIAAGNPARAKQAVPSPRPASFVLVFRTGGPRRNEVVDDAQVTIEAWAKRSEDAHDLAQLCRAWLHAMRGEVVGGATVYRIDEFSGPADLPDPTSAQARYTFTASVSVRYVSLLPG